MVGRLPTAFQQIPVIPYILCCLDVACSSTLDLCISDALVKFCDTLRCTIVWQQQRLLGRFCMLVRAITQPKFLLRRVNVNTKKKGLICL